MRSGLPALGTVSLLILLAACSPARLRLSFQLRRIPAAEVLIPPGIEGRLPKTVQHFRIRHARTCSTAAGSFRFAVHKSRATLTTNLKNAVINGHILVGTLRGIDRFRSGLHQLEAQRCLPAGASDRILQHVEEAMALPTAVAVYLRYGAYPLTGSIDLIPGMRLKEVTPMKAANGQVGGYETTWYNVQPQYVGGVRLRRAHRPSDAPRRARRHGFRPVPVELTFPAGARFLRILLLLARSRANHPVLFLGGSDQFSLDQATALVRRQPARCEHLAGPAWCHAVPYGASLTAEMNLRVEGKTLYLPVDDTVADALQTAGQLHPRRLEPRLQVFRRFGTTRIPVLFNRNQPDIFSLPLIGGDQLRW